MRKLVFAFLLLAGAAVLPGARAQEGHIERDTNRPGNDYANFAKDDATGCALSCRLQDDKCRAWTFDKRNTRCWLKTTASPPRRETCCTSGLQDPPGRPVPIDGR
jgi:hypothetical protein